MSGAGNTIGGGERVVARDPRAYMSTVYRVFYKVWHTVLCKVFFRVYIYEGGVYMSTGYSVRYHHTFHMNLFKVSRRVIL